MIHATGSTINGFTPAFTQLYPQKLWIKSRCREIIWSQNVLGAIFLHLVPRLKLECRIANATNPFA